MNLSQIKKSENTDITVILPSYNRAQTLRETLRHFTDLKFDQLKVEFVIIDNNSTDNTVDIVKHFKDRISIKYLFEPVQGKNAAINKALSTVELGEIVVFTDDDVRPEHDWLVKIENACRRNPDIQVYGGKVNAIWPDMKIPIWACDKEVKIWGLAIHDYSQNETVYENGSTPHGINCWVKRDLLEKFRFDESVGPTPTNRIMGGETEFFSRLQKNNYQILYCPDCIVGHCIQSSDFSYFGLTKRAFRRGKGVAVGTELARENLFKRHPVFWRGMRYGIVAKQSFEYAILLGLAPINRQYEKPLRKMIGIGFNVQVLKKAKQVSGS